MKVATPPHVLKWFAERQISQATLDRFGVHWNGKKIVIPIKDPTGTVLFNKYRRDPLSTDGPKYTYDKGAHTALFNHQPDVKVIILTEGEADCIKLEDIGFAACSSTGGSQSFQAEWVPLFEGKKVFVLYDNDQAGAVGAVKVAHLVPHAKIVPFPAYTTAKDITDYLKDKTLHDLIKLLTEAYVLPVTIDDCAKLKRELVANDLSTKVINEQLRFLNQNRKKKSYVKIDVKNIKDIPITNFMKFDSTHKTKCPFHNEKTASFHYYPESNTAYCFGGCGKRFDVIDVYRQINSCSFVEAVKRLKEMI